jgi:WD40 repeat protein
MQESLTLDLVSDCSRFVTQHFEIISTSSPHIYHSALTLAPRESLVQKLYKSHARPFVRVVCGVPALWDLKAATATFDCEIELAVWSPCNRFIAIGPKRAMAVNILDSTTLQRIQSLGFPQISSLSVLAFSPDSRTLTSVICNNDMGTAGAVVSWDLQTGGIVSTIEWEGLRDVKLWEAHIPYSMNGKMVAVLFRYRYSSIISIYDVASGVSMPHILHGAGTDLDSGTLYGHKIWTHGGSLRFATPEPLGITIWEVGFTSGATPTEVESVSVQGNAIQAFVFGPREQKYIRQTEFHPVSCRLAFTDVEGTLFVWDTRTSEFLLHHPGVDFCPSMTFSSDARFFACTTMDSEVYLWKELPTGYTLFKKLTPGTPEFEPSFSPNGESIIAFGRSKIQLWHMKSFASTTSTILASAHPHAGQDFILEFLPNRPLAVTTRRGDERVMIIDLESGALQLTIDTPMWVCGLKLTGNTIVVMGAKEAIAWNLPGGNFLPDARMDVKNSAWKINLGPDDWVVAASMSPDFQCVVRSKYHRGEGLLEVYYTSTGQILDVEVRASALWFAPDGRNIWCAAGNEAMVFTLTQDALHHTNTVANIEDGSWGCPWGSRRGYKVTHDGWILCASGKRLLMLPPLWQSRFKVDRVWSWKFLALLHGELPEPVILELEP